MMDFPLKVKMFESVLLTRSGYGSPEESQLPPLVADTLEAVAAQRDARVDALA